MALPRPGAAFWAGLGLAGLGLWHALLAPLPLLARLEQVTEDWRQQLRSQPVTPTPTSPSSIWTRPACRPWGTGPGPANAWPP
jgi:hypothetical protein